MDKHTHEEGIILAPKFDAAGLVTTVVSDADSGEILMLAYMNAEALALTISTREAHFWSRSRAELWHKGATSGNVLVVEDIRVDCDQDAIWVIARPQGHGAACHTGRRSCFYRSVTGTGPDTELKIVGDAPLFDPKAVYGK
ncbi:phosphoribosyl-AMP cyclohydrolase [Ahrensia sp. R2A130]|uniref:phosphoribosyl-AMP cyclohydrolase n=1 Tax=Ahrensia sp. R2A130 TaxID=744979 RepID=UPI0001E0F824|nr:phosphoribosyl-AMP cyclohydrolase [Ahrensia sp. R2A130]EFL90460.1 phosphoribosyl-AMP cyclohydrolase [Ahrensia sp. R2A130]